MSSAETGHLIADPSLTVETWLRGLYFTAIFCLGKFIHAEKYEHRTNSPSEPALLTALPVWQKYHAEVQPAILFSWVYEL